MSLKNKWEKFKKEWFSCNHEPFEPSTHYKNCKDRSFMAGDLGGKKSIRKYSVCKKCHKKIAYYYFVNVWKTEEEAPHLFENIIENAEHGPEIYKFICWMKWHTNIEIEHDVDKIFETFYEKHYDLLPEESSFIKSHVITYNHKY